MLMTLSPEAIEKSFKDIELLQKEVKSLKKRLGVLTNRFNELDNLGLQDQIFDLSERITSFSKEFNDKMQDFEHELLGLSCYVCATHINEDVDTFSALIDDSKLRDKSDMITQLIADASHLKAEIFTSKRPNRLAVEFHRKWSEYLRSLGIKFINF